MDPFIHRCYCVASFVYRLSFFIFIRIMRFDMESKEGRDVSQADQPDLFLPSESELQMAQVGDVFDYIHNYNDWRDRKASEVRLHARWVPKSCPVNWVYFR